MGLIVRLCDGVYDGAFSGVRDKCWPRNGCDVGIKFAGTQKKIGWTTWIANLSGGDG